MAATLITDPRPLTMRSTDATWTAADLEQLPDDGRRYEIIDGRLYMSTAPSLFHQWIVSRAYMMLDRQLTETGLAYVFFSPVGVFMPGCDPVQPDIVVVLREDHAMLRDKRVRGVPALLVEILSPSNADVDLETKLATYARAGVSEYWIARPAERDLLIYTEPEAATGRYLTAAHIPPDGELVSPTLPVRAQTAAFFAGVPDTSL